MLMVFFVHINPLQEFLQPEGDRFLIDPLLSIKSFIKKCPFKVFVKEVGQGFGPREFEALNELEVAGIEFGAFGGTNFSKLELLRGEGRQNLNPLCQVGHTAEEMIEFIKRERKTFSLIRKLLLVVVSQTFWMLTI